MTFSLPSEPDDPEAQAMPNRLDQQERCREQGRSHCNDRNCTWFISCPMSTITEETNRGRGIPSLYQIPSQNGEAVQGYTTLFRERLRRFFRRK